MGLNESYSMSRSKHFFKWICSLTQQPLVTVPGKRFLFTFSLSKLSMALCKLSVPGRQESSVTGVLSCASAPTAPGTRSRRWHGASRACSSLADAGLEVRNLSCCPSEKMATERKADVDGRRRPRRLLRADEVPQHRCINRNILSGYRPPSGLCGCVQSLGYAHNETINIYTHGECGGR